MRDEAFTIQSKLDGLTRQYSVDNYDNAIDMLISLSLNRSIIIRKKRDGGNIRIYKTRNPFSIFNHDDVFVQELGKNDRLVFDKTRMRFSKESINHQ